MAGKSRRSKLILSDENRAELEQLSRSRRLPHREAQRAAIILGYYGGEKLPPPQGTSHWRRCQSVGGSSGVLETGGSGLCGRSLESASAGTACSGTCRGRRFSFVVAGGKSDGTPNPGGTATSSGEGQVLPGAARS